MNNRFLFRAWDPTANVMTRPFDLRVIGALQAEHLLMQCTGLGDARGVLIYEDDILDAKAWSSVRRVRWRNGSFHTLAARASHASVTTVLRAQRIYQEQMVIVGNIYQTPELTKLNTRSLLLEASG